MANKLADLEKEREELLETMSKAIPADVMQHINISMTIFNASVQANKIAVYSAGGTTNADPE
jgi:hypothetical protein